MATKYTSRTKEKVMHVWHNTDLDGKVTISDGRRYTEFVYKRKDGSEFVGLRDQSPVRRVDGVPCVDRHSKEIEAITASELFGPHSDIDTPSVVLAIGGGLVAIVRY